MGLWFGFVISKGSNAILWICQRCRFVLPGFSMAKLKKNSSFFFKVNPQPPVYFFSGKIAQSMIKTMSINQIERLMFRYHL